MEHEEILVDEKDQQPWVGKKNIYTCHSCGSHIVTVDLDPGVTPFTIKCVGLLCNGHMQSSMYRVFDQKMKPSHEWYRPTTIQNLTDGERDHVQMGGLLLRSCD